MQEIILDAIIDTVKLIPFLFVTYLAMEYLEGHTEGKFASVVKRSGRLGPLFGGLLGAFPQCGFSAAAANLFAGRVVTVGTVVAIFMSTSDELIPIFLSEKVEIALLIKTLLIKVLVGCFWGFAIDIVRRVVLRIVPEETNIRRFCEREKCHCEDVITSKEELHHLSDHRHHHGIVFPALRHTVQISAFVFIVNLLLGFVIEKVGIESVSSITMDKPVLSIFIMGVIGLIPNCGASVAITQLFLEGMISFSAMITGLLTGAGVGLMVLFRVNASLRENMTIMTVLYVLSVITGIIFQISGVL